MLKPLTCTAVAGLSLFQGALAQAEDQDHSHVSPVTNPLFFEDPHITSEVRPIYMYHKIDDTFVTQGGYVRVYAVQLRYALTERLALIATKDGFIQFRPSAVLPHKDGWADIGGGLKYAIIDDKKNDFILTAGLKFEAPSGNERVFQGNGKGEWDAFVSSQKGWDNLHVTGSAGIRVPNDFSKETTQLHYSAQVDYATCRYFIPFVAANAFSTLNNANQLALGHEGYDLINFGVSNGAGKTQVTGGLGFRSRVTDHVDLGFAYERGLTHPKALFDQRFTLDVIVHF